MEPHERLVLVTGATGYIGGRLVPQLLARGYRVRILARDASRVASRPWAADVEIAEGDARDGAAVEAALAGVHTCYFLLHSLSPDNSFEADEAATASTFADAASETGLSQFIYLGGIIDPTDDDLSPHLRSRMRVGQILQQSGIPTLEFRAAVILGSGSASFEMLRYLAERLPLMTTPKWVRSRIQPIAVRDVLYYLAEAAALPPTTAIYDIGGPDVLTYEDMMRRYAKAAGLPKPFIIPVPVLSPGLSSHWVGLITPVPPTIARPLVESLKHEVVCANHDVADIIPDPIGGLIPFDDACQLALQRIRDAQVATRWSGATLPTAPSQPWPGDPHWSGGSLYTDRRVDVVDADPEVVWQVVERIGGEHGWYSWPTAWKARALIDQIVGGAGFHRGRRDPERLEVGDAVDFWRVEEKRPPQVLRLRAEMKMPGIGWLEFTLTPTIDGRTVVTQRALFHPRGLAGHAYWKSVKPFHNKVFTQMLHTIKTDAETRQKQLNLSAQQT